MNIKELFEKINKDDNCLFVAYMTFNFTYLSVNAFVRLLHDKYGYDSISGFIINGRNDPNYGHSFADDSFRFPDYCKISVVHLCDDNCGDWKERLIKSLSFFKKGLIVRRRNPRLYVLCTDYNFLFLANAIALTDKRVEYVYLNTGGVELDLVVCLPRELRKLILRIPTRLCTYNSFAFSPFSLIRMKRNHEVEHLFTIATEEEELDIMGKDPKERYVLFVSQNGLYQKYNYVIEKVLDRELENGLNVYIKPHTHEREYSFPQKKGYNVLPIGYAVESVVGGAMNKPEKIISFTSSALFSCSAWYETSCYSLVNYIPSKEFTRAERRFIRLVKSGEYPDLHFYDEIQA